jgi:hypothetical protein
MFIVIEREIDYLVSYDNEVAYETKGTCYGPFSTEQEAQWFGIRRFGGLDACWVERLNEPVG